MSRLPPNYGMPIALGTAKKIMLAAEAEASRNSWPMVIAIVDSSGHLLLLQRMDQAQYGSIAIAQLKAETALNFRRPTKAFEDAIAAGGQGVRIVSMPNVLALEGGLPIVVDGNVVGAIGVSGMQSDQDAQVARAGLDALG
ncbi:MAG: heme-binding protein [Rudaea sp.]|nr:heme-binding protein [Rudaea sp.]